MKQNNINNKNKVILKINWTLSLSATLVMAVLIAICFHLLAKDTYLGKTIISNISIISFLVPAIFYIITFIINLFSKERTTLKYLLLLIPQVINFIISFYVILLDLATVLSQIK